MTAIRLIDINPEIVKAFQERFKDEAGVEVVQGDITKQDVDVWVTPTNSKGHMSGGVDYAVKNALGQGIENSIQSAIVGIYGGHLPVGRAIIVDNHASGPKWVVATPSMVGESDNLKRTKNTALACAAAFQAIYYAEEKHGAEIGSIAIPGLGSGTGKVPPNLCAELMYIGYTLFRRKRYESFDEMLSHLNEELGLIGQGEAAKAGPQPDAGQVQQSFGFEAFGKLEKFAKADDETAPEDDTPDDEDSHGQQGGDEVSATPIVAYVKDTPIGTPII